MKKIVSFVLILLAILSGCEEGLDPKTPGLLVPKTADEDPSVPSIAVNGTLLHAQTFGDSADPMVVILHGGPGSDYRSMLNAQDLAGDGYFVVMYDQRGSGLSKRHDKNAYSLQVMQDDLAAVIEHYRTSANQKIFLLGHSWGAMLATAYINSSPTAVAGAILAEPGGFSYDQMKAYIEESHSLEFFDEAANDATYVDQFLTGKESDQEILDYKLALVAAHDDAEGNAIGNVGSTPLWRKGAVVFNTLLDYAAQHGFDWTTNLNQYDTPVLFIYGETNTAYGRAHAEEVSAAYPRVQLEEIQGAGHEMIYSGWANTRPLILNYLNKLK